MTDSLQEKATRLAHIESYGYALGTDRAWLIQELKVSWAREATMRAALEQVRDHGCCVMHNDDQCPECDGDGWSMKGFSKVSCEACGGSGILKPRAGDEER